MDDMWALPLTEQNKAKISVSVDIIWGQSLSSSDPAAEPQYPESAPRHLPAQSGAFKKMNTGTYDSVRPEVTEEEGFWLQLWGRPSFFYSQ